MARALLKRECYSNTSVVLTVSVKNPSVTVTLGRCYGYTGYMTKVIVTLV